MRHTLRCAFFFLSKITIEAGRLFTPVLPATTRPTQHTGDVTTVEPTSGGEESACRVTLAFSTLHLILRHPPVTRGRYCTGHYAVKHGYARVIPIRGPRQFHPRNTVYSDSFNIFTPSQHVTPDRVRVLESPQIPETLSPTPRPTLPGWILLRTPSAGFAGGAGVRTGDPRI